MEGSGITGESEGPGFGGRGRTARELCFAAGLLRFLNERLQGPGLPALCTGGFSGVIERVGTGLDDDPRLGIAAVNFFEVGFDEREHGTGGFFVVEVGFDIFDHAHDLAGEFLIEDDFVRKIDQLRAIEGE